MAERVRGMLIGSIRRKCLGDVVVLGEIPLLRIPAGYLDYNNRARCLSGERAVGIVPRNRGVVLTVVGAVALDGVRAMMATA